MNNAMGGDLSLNYGQTLDLLDKLRVLQYPSLELCVNLLGHTLQVFEQDPTTFTKYLTRCKDSANG